jgi:ribosome-binding factor A
MRRHFSSGSGGARGARIADQIQQELAELIQRDIKDPRIGFTTLTGVDLTPDYAYATVFFTVLPDTEAQIANTLSGLRSAAGFMRAELGRRIRIHTTPELRFRYDQSTERGMAMSRLIDQALGDQPAALDDNKV